MEYLVRSVDRELDELLPYIGAISLDGAKGVGKTATATARVQEILRLDTEEGRLIYAGDTSLTSFPRPLLIDEWQHVPDVWNVIRHQVDDGAAPGSFLVTGSATPREAEGTHSGAGRILSLRMRPMGMHERGLGAGGIAFASLLNPDYEASGRSEAKLDDYAEEIVSSGFPGIRTLPERIRARQLASYLQLVIDRDLPEGGYSPRNPAHLHQWMAAYAAATATTASLNSLSRTVAQDGTSLSRETTAAYREHLTRIWILDQLPGWIAVHNPLKRVAQAPKHFLADPALAASLLGLSASALLRADGAHMLGPLFEALAVLTLRVLAQTEGLRCFHLRTQNGAREIDMILEGEGGAVLPVEIKAKSVPDAKDSRHIRWLRETWGGKVLPGVIISTGSRAYMLPDGTRVVPLAMLE